MDFTGKVAVITGSSSGIGEATAIKFASLGANIVVTGRDETKIKNVAQRCHELSKQKVLEVRADLTIESDIKNLINKTIDEFGRLDILVNNAGIVIYRSAEDQNIMEAFDIVMNTNVRSALSLISLALPYLEKSRGSIINVSSIAGLKPLPLMMSYCASKSALDMITKCLATELGPKGIRSCPYTYSMLNNGDLTVEKVAEYCRKSYPLRRIGETEDVANAIVFTCSDKASFINGAIIPVDGGSVNDSPMVKTD